MEPYKSLGEEKHLGGVLVDFVCGKSLPLQHKEFFWWGEGGF